MKKITVLDLFSGIGGFHLGLEKAGYKVKSYFSEIDKHPIAVYKNNFKNSTYVGSVTDVRKEQLPKINLITFGSPCQDFSLAGNRKGMGGERSSLILEAIRLIDECRPRVFIWENVKGTFSSNDGEDFWAIIKAFTDIGGYRLEWQLCNTKWFLPQNRERIYLVGHLGGGSGSKIFPIGESNKQIDELQGQFTNTLTARYDGEGNGSYIIEGEQYAQKGIKKVGVYGSGNPTKGGTGPLSRDDGNTYCLDTGNSQAIEIKSSMRRLTPLECERLQGFPDHWTMKGVDGDKIVDISDSQRYKQCGNAVSVPVVQAVGLKIKELIND